MLNIGCIFLYLKYYTLNLMPLMVYPKVLSRVDIHRYIQCLASGVTRQPACHLRADSARAAAVPQAVNPRLLIFVEGTQGQNYPVEASTNGNAAGKWWGGEGPLPLAGGANLESETVLDDAESVHKADHCRG